jgi:5'-3' exoribonuclease 2
MVSVPTSSLRFSTLPREAILPAPCSFPCPNADGLIPISTPILTLHPFQGVPALFRWLSKKYPKIVSRVVEETPTKVRNSDGEIVEVPVRYEGQNPNGFEVDNLYRTWSRIVLKIGTSADADAVVVDMNGIVHPCTHPEGKPAPETEEDMMVEIFNYTERVVNMARPRKVLMMAIGKSRGVSLSRQSERCVRQLLT